MRRQVVGLYRVDVERYTSPFAPRNMVRDGNTVPLQEKESRS